MRKILPLILVCVLGFSGLILIAQDGPISPSIIGTGKYFGLTPPLSELPTISLDEFAQMALDADKKEK